jgi:hypothetical protein
MAYVSFPFVLKNSQLKPSLHFGPKDHPYFYHKNRRYIEQHPIFLSWYIQEHVSLSIFYEAQMSYRDLKLISLISNVLNDCF